MSNRDERLIFNTARRIEAGDARSLYLKQACADEQVLLARVEALLRAHEDDGFLQSPVVSEIPFTPAVREGPGTQIGPYTLIEKLGEGGFGTVFLAEQREPVRRKVALKILKLGMDTVQVVSRFEAERQALAMMEHPNVARVLDGGTTDGGRPYFVMELVNGLPITQYCDEYQLSPHDRLSLFAAVCKAVQHAHQKGIIHRDLKPTNVLVAAYDGHPVPKIIDFGVAKALGERLTERTVVTTVGGIIGTLEYMSPEQAEFNARDVDTRADIYSLGVILYELLTGTTPLTRERLKLAALSDALRLIREEEPPRPSTRLGDSKNSRAAISAQRKFEPERLARELRGDLDWIVMKALDKDRDRRYQTANGLARDIERYLHDEPVEACPPSTAYKLTKFARKNRKLLTAVSAFAMLLSVATVVSGWMAYRATIAEQATGRERDRAEAEAARARTHVYAAHMNLAQNAWDGTRLGRLVALLDEHRPRAAEEDLCGFEWHYWRRLVDAPIASLEGHHQIVFCVAYRADGKRLASASYDETAKIWDARDGRQLHTLRHSDQVTGVAFSPDGNQLATTSADRTAKIWDAASGSELYTLSGHSDRLTSAAFSPDGKSLATASYDRTIKLWNVADGSELRTIQAHSDWVHAIAFSPDGKRLASASKDRTVKIWDTPTWAELLTLKGHTHAVMGVAFSPDGERLASAGNDHKIKLWNMATGECERTLAGHTDRVYGIAFSPDGRRVASSSLDMTVRVWDAASGQKLALLKGHTRWVSHVTFSPDGRQLASASADRTVKIWNVLADQGESLEMRQAKRFPPARSVAFSPDGALLASTSDDPQVALWDTRSGLKVGALAGHQHSVYSIAFSPDGKQLASAAMDQTIALWDVDGRRKLFTWKGPASKSGAVAFSPDGRWLAAGDDQNTVRVWNAAGDAEQKIFRGHQGSVTSVAFSPDGKRLASASMDLTVKLWDCETGSLLRSLGGPSGYPRRAMSVAFSPSGDHLASAGDGYSVRIWDAATGQPLQTLEGHINWATGLAFSPDGDRLASASSDKTIKLWDLASGEETLTLRGGSGWFTCVAFSRDGRRLAGADHQGRVWLWDARPWTDQLRTEQQARGVIQQLFATKLSKEEMTSAIQSDQALSADVRQSTFNMVERWQP